MAASNAADQGNRTKRRLISGLLGAVAVAVVLALVFTVGGVGKKDKAAPKPLDTETAIKSDVTPAKDTKIPVVPTVEIQKPATVTTPTIPATTETTPVAAATTTTPATTTTTPAAPAADNSLINNLASTADTTTAKEMDPANVPVATGGSDTCYAADYDELSTAVTEGTCGTIILSNYEDDAYAFDDEILVSRRVTITGNPATLPKLDCSGAMRCFHVVAGGFLNLAFVRTEQGSGVTRPRGDFISGGYGLDDDVELPEYGQVVEIRGGAVYFDKGAVGGNFKGVVFRAVFNTIDTVTAAIETTKTLTGGRLYGGHVCMVTGTVTFTGCLFWDTSILTPLSDQIVVGGDVLVLGGSLFMTGCFFTFTGLFALTNMIGGNVAVFAGLAVFQLMSMQGQNIVSACNGVGQVLFVGGGVMVMNAVDYRLVVGLLSFTGLGDFFTAAGVMVMNGVTITNSYPVFSALGGGFYNAVGAGVMIKNGVTFDQFNGPNYQALTGGSIFVGTGHLNMVGVPGSYYGTTGAYQGQGSYAWIGSGNMILIGCPLAVFVATWAFFGLGGTFANDAGVLVYIGTPVFSAAAVGCFFGQGGHVFLGAGIGIIDHSPAFFYGPPITYAPNVFNWWISGCRYNDNVKGAGWVAAPATCPRDDCVCGPAVGDNNATRHVRYLEDWNGARERMDQNVINVAKRLGSRALNTAEDVATLSSEIVQDGVKGLTQMRINQPFDSKNKIHSVYFKNTDVRPQLPENFGNNFKISSNSLKKLQQPLNSRRELGFPGQGGDIMVGPNTECSMCGITANGAAAQIDGPGASACQTAASCDDPTFKAPVSLTSFTETNLQKLVFPDVFLTMSKVTLTCKTGETCGTPGMLKEVFGAALPMSGIPVSVAGEAIDEMFKEMAMPATTRLNPKAGCDGVTTTFNLNFVNLEGAAAQATRALLGGMGADDVVAQIQAKDSNICDVEMASTTPTRFDLPSLNSDLAKTFAATLTSDLLARQGVGSLEVASLNEPNKQLGPNNAAVTTDNYMIRINGFTEGAKLTMEARGSAPYTKSDGTEATRTVLIPLDDVTFHPNPDGSAMEIQWKPQLRLKDMIVFLRATDSTGAYVDSLPFSVGTTRRRRLSGRAHILDVYGA